MRPPLISQRQRLLMPLAVALMVGLLGCARDRQSPEAGESRAAGLDGGHDAAPRTPAASPNGGAAERAVAVLTAPVVTRDVPLYLEGIGSVVPLKTVTVRSQVDGLLDRVAFEEGRAVRKGDLLAQIDPRPYAIARDQAAAAIARDQAQLRSARLTLQRYETVRKENLIAQQQVDEQRATVEQLEATARSDQAQLEHARLQLDYARIRSPIDGVTGVRLVDPGNLVRAADAGGIVVLTQLDPIAVLFSLPQDDLPRIAARMAEATLKVEVLSRDGGTTLGTGTLALVDNQINQATASVRLKAVFPNPKRSLWPNQFVKARLLLTMRQGAHVLPAAAIQRGPQGSFVYVVGADSRAVVTPVKLDAIEGDLAVIASGVEPGSSVVVEGQAQFRAGARVNAKPADAVGAHRAGGRGGSRPSGGGGASPAEAP